MATRSRSKEPNFWEENRSLISGGLVVLIILALGFLAFDTITRNSKNQDSKQKSSQEKKNDSKNSSDSKDSNKKDDGKTSSDKSNNNSSQPKVGQGLPTSHVVIKGESLWKLAQQYYNDGYKWTVIAKENKLTNPDVLYSGTKLTIPQVAAATTGPTATLPTSYTVVRGDNLWNLAMKYYGSGYQWYKIRDANAGKVGLLANGRPLIRPGSVLTIPK